MPSRAQGTCYKENGMIKNNPRLDGMAEVDGMDRIRDGGGMGWIGLTRSKKCPIAFEQIPTPPIHPFLLKKKPSTLPPSTYLSKGGGVDGGVFLRGGGIGWVGEMGGMGGDGMMDGMGWMGWEGWDSWVAWPQYQVCDVICAKKSEIQKS